MSRLSRPVYELVERFERNPRIKNADEDIREQRFLVEHEKMFLIYHKKDNYITASSRNFEKVEVQDINGFKFFNPKVSRAPLPCGDNCFRVIRDLSDFISFPEVRNDSYLA